MSEIPPRLTPSDNDPRRTSPARNGQTGIWVVLVLLAALVIVVMAYSSNMWGAPSDDPATAVETPAEPANDADSDAGETGAIPGVEETAPAENPPATNP